jgi:hypothetical protein
MFSYGSDEAFFRWDRDRQDRDIYANLAFQLGIDLIDDSHHIDTRSHISRVEGNFQARGNKRQGVVSSAILVSIGVI